MYEKLTKAINLDTGEEYIFGDGDLESYSDDKGLKWRSTLASVENGNSFSKAIRKKEFLKLKFITDEGHEYKGTVMVKRIEAGKLGVYVYLLGVGELKSLK